MGYNLIITLLITGRDPPCSYWWVHVFWILYPECMEKYDSTPISSEHVSDGVVQAPHLGGGFIHMFRLLQGTKPRKRLWIITWNPKQPLINGCFNWMIPNLYIENGCFTKHPFINGCLGFRTHIPIRIHLCPKDPGLVLLQSYDRGDGMDDLDHQSREFSGMKFQRMNL